ncbi:MAG: META domain-containing protein [Alistipes sp.]|nr:META domain-containing protein [Alistipes sp.]
MKNMISILVVAVVAVAMVGCCACRKGKNNKPLTGTEWHLERMMGQEVDIDADQFVFVFSNDGRFSGVGACNRMMGDYSITDKGAIKFGALAGTRMMCPKAHLESEFTKIIGQATHYEIDGELLLILSNGELQAVFRAR